MEFDFDVLVLGLGPVGLVTAVGFAELGHRVLGVDIQAAKVNALKQGKVPFYEPGVEPALQKHLREHRIAFDHDAAPWIPRAEVIFVCVGTPTKPSGEADLSAVRSVVEEVRRHAHGYTLVVEKSTVPVLTARWMEQEFQKVADHDIEVASNPEFLREGSALNDFPHPDRIVLGVRSSRAEHILRNLYRGIETEFLVTDIETAEIIKHASNAFLAMKISFINMIADLCEKTGADVVDVARGMGLDPRIGPSFLRAGLGFGGSCFPKDIRAFQHIGQTLQLDFELLTSILRINEQRIHRFVQHFEEVLGDLKGRTLALLGLSFKPNTDDIREAPSLKVIQALRARGARLHLHDPVAIPNVQKLFPESPPDLIYFEDPYEAIRDADGLGIITEWDLYQTLDLPRVKSLLKRPVVVDGRNIFDPETMLNLGFVYRGMGRGRWLRKKS